MTNEDLLNLHNYAIDTREAFDAKPANQLPEGLQARAAEFEGTWVIWDAFDDSAGLLLIGDDKDKLTKEAVEHLELSERAPG